MVISWGGGHRRRSPWRSTWVRFRIRRCRRFRSWSVRRGYGLTRSRLSTAGGGSPTPRRGAGGSKVGGRRQGGGGRAAAHVLRAGGRGAAGGAGAAGERCGAG